MYEYLFKELQQQFPSFLTDVSVIIAVAVTASIAEAWWEKNQPLRNLFLGAKERRRLALIAAYVALWPLCFFFIFFSLELG